MRDTKKKRNVNLKTLPDIKEFPKIPVKKFRKTFIFLIFAIAGILSFLIIHENGTHELTIERTKKFEKAIERVEKRKHEKENCEQYVLRAAYSGWFPLLKWGEAVAQDSIWLNEGDVWKYGFTCVGEFGRYPQRIYYDDGNKKLTWLDLTYSTQVKGTEKECKIEEKRKIYNYPLLHECQVRKIKLIRPPGNKNDN
jgi:cell division protein FtsL